MGACVPACVRERERGGEAERIRGGGTYCICELVCVSLRVSVRESVSGRLCACLCVDLVVCQEEEERVCEHTF